MIYVGVIPPGRYLAAIGLQILWLAILGGLSALMWRAGARRVVVQGG